MPNLENISSSQILWLYSYLLSNAVGFFIFFNSIFASGATLSATMLWTALHIWAFDIPFMLPMAVAEIGFVAPLHYDFRFMWKWPLLWLLGQNNVVIVGCYFIPLIRRHMNHRKWLEAAKPPLYEIVESMWPFMNQAFFINIFLMNDIWWVPFGDDADDEMQFYIGQILIFEGLAFLFCFRKLVF